MTGNDDMPIAEVARIALASAPAAHRAVWQALFALDARLGKIVAQAREPALAQLRLAWWRDELGKPAEQRALSDPLLHAVTREWAGAERAPIALIDGWEALLGDDTPTALAEFADGRGTVCAAIARRIGCDREGAAIAGRLWAYADCAACPREEEGGRAAIALAEALPPAGPLPRALRPLAVIAGLSRRALRRGGAPLIGDRLSPLVAFRLGISGR